MRHGRVGVDQEDVVCVHVPVHHVLALEQAHELTRGSQRPADRGTSLGSEDPVGQRNGVRDTFRHQVGPVDRARRVDCAGHDSRCADASLPRANAGSELSQRALGADPQVPVGHQGRDQAAPPIVAHDPFAAGVRVFGPGCRYGQGPTSTRESLVPEGGCPAEHGPVPEHRLEPLRGPGPCEASGSSNANVLVSCGEPHGTNGARPLKPGRRLRSLPSGTRWDPRTSDLSPSPGSGTDPRGGRRCSREA